MSTLTTDIQKLRKKTSEGKAVYLQQQNRSERLARKELYEAAEFRFKSILPTILQKIDQMAASQGKSFHDHIVLATSWDKAILKHTWYEGDFIWAQSLTKTSIRSGFNHKDYYSWEIIKKSDCVRGFKEFEVERRIVWMCTKKLAKYFLDNEFEVSIGQKEINITSEFQHQERYKSSLHKLPCLRISWK